MAEAVAARQPAQMHRSDPQRASSNAARHRSAPQEGTLTHLQRAAGNRAMYQLLRSNGVQPKLTVSPADDEYEREADQVADQVLRMPDSAVQPARAAESEPPSAPAIVQRMCPECEEEEEDEPIQRTPDTVQRMCPECEAEEDGLEVQRAPAVTPLRHASSINRMCAECEQEAEGRESAGTVQRKVAGDQEENEKEEQLAPVIQAKSEDGAAPAAPPDLEGYVASSRGAGQPLPGPSLAYFEPRFGQEFGHVRIHTDQWADRAAAGINALAFTTGSDISFRSGLYQPGTVDGDRLLAHELTHVVQQGAARGALGGVPALAQPQVQLQAGLRAGPDTVARAWNSCGAPEDCPPRNSGERTRAASATLQVGQLDAPEPGEIISHFPIGSNRITSLRTNPTWTAFVGVILTEDSRWEILGFSDCQGAVELNTDVRTRRAQAVFNLLPAAAKAKIDRAVAAPLSDCVGTNDTESNRSFNRSVVFRRTLSMVTFEGEDIEVTIPDFLCGPDVTAQVAAAVAKTKTMFAGWSTDEKEDSCDGLDSLLRGGAAWDIVDLHNNAWIHRNYRPPCATAGGTPPCGSSVQVDNDCYYAGSANYVIFGVMCKLCADYYLSIPLINTGFARFTRRSMHDLIDLYKGTGLSGLATPSANFAESVAWADAGYDGWPAGGSPPAGDRNNCAPKCPTPYRGRPFVVYWDPKSF